MNPVLVYSIRARIQEQTTEQLLELWTTNDRAMWSTEAFEAVKSLLVERGISQLPPQGAPAPIALPYSPTRDPTSQYWLGWMRPVLWLSIAVGLASIPRTVSVFWLMFVSGTADGVLRSMGAGQFWLSLVLGDAVLPAVLLIGAAACLRFRPWGRQLLVGYAAAAIGTIVAAFVLYQIRMMQYFDLPMPWALNAAEETLSLSRSLVLPLVLWWLMRRPEIRSIFTSTPSAPAFEIKPASPN